MVNNIEFKYVDSTSTPICGLTINYSVKVVAVLTNINDPESLIPRGAVYTSGVIEDGVETTDSNGVVTIDVTNVFSDSEFLQIFTKFNNSRNYNVSIEIKLESEKQEIGPSMYISTTNIPTQLSAYNVVFSIKEDDYEYPELVYWDEYTEFTVDEIVINEELLKAVQAKKLKSQRSYIDLLEDFQNEISSQSILQIPILNEYDPININQIITRCLELSVGTIDNGLSYTTDAGLVAETNRLTKIKTLINQISNLYPSTTIEDGEGIPYQNIGVIPEPFRGFGFYQKGGEIFVSSYISDYQFGGIVLGGKDCKKGIKIPAYPILITLNGEYFYGEGITTAFDFNITNELSKQGITLVDGDILNLSVFLDCTYYNSKLIIKN
jgi:hypothetical protein